MKIKILSAIILFTISFGVYFGALSNGFVWHDSDFIKDNNLIKNPANAVLLFKTDISNYSPLAGLTLMFDYYVWKENALGYHLTNNLLHSFNTILIFLIFCAFSVKFGFIAALIFALLPANAQTVLFVHNRAELTSFLFYAFSSMMLIRFFASKKIFYTTAFLTVVLTIFAVKPNLVYKTDSLFDILPALIGLFPVAGSAQNTLYVVSFITSVFFAYLFVRVMSLKFKKTAAVVFCGAVFAMSWISAGASWKWRSNSEFYQHLLSKNLNNKEAHYGLAMEYFSKGEIYKSISEIDKALAIDKNFAQGYYQLGVINESVSDYAAAKKCYEKALDLDPALYNAYNNLGVCYSKLNDLDSAEKNYLLSLNNKPDNADTYYNLARIYEKKNLTARAQEYYEKAVRFNPGHSDALNNLGVIYDSKARFAEASKLYELAIKHKPENGRAYFNLALNLHQRGLFNQAEDNYKTAMRKGFITPELFNNLGTLYAKQQLFDQALMYHKKAVDLNPGYIDALKNTGLDYLGLSDLANARRQFVKLLKIEPKNMLVKKTIENIDNFIRSKKAS